MKRDRTDWLVWLVAVGFVLVCFFASGCAAMPGKETGKVVASQLGGTVSGAGATMTTPNNAATPSTQSAYKRTIYQDVRKDKPDVPEIRFKLPQELEVPAQSPNVAQQVAQKVESTNFVEVPASVEEWTETTIGSHQDLDSIIKSMGSALKVITLGHVLGLLMVIVGSGGVMWSMGNPNGYMAVFLGLLIVGVLLLVTGNVWWLAVAALPALFWLGQKLGIIRIPLVP